MELKLAENIRAFRRSKNMTQEQLAEALGVTVGAVSKWESAATTPEIGMIVRIAEFFETSVDVLLGYKLQSGTLPQMLEQIKALREDRNYAEAIRVGEKALQKFPNHFDAVYQTALCYLYSGGDVDKELIRRAQQLLRRSLELIGQNNDAEINSWLIRNQLGESYLYLRQSERALEIYKENNFNGINNARIAQVLSDVLKRDEEASIYARKAYRSMMEYMINTMVALASVSEKKDDLADFFECINWLNNTMESVRPDNGVCVYDKTLINLYQAVSEVYLRINQRELAKDYLKKAFHLANKYDSTPLERIVECRFFPERLPGLPYLDSGHTAREMMEARLHWNSREEVPEYYVLWDEVANEQVLKEKKFI